MSLADLNKTRNLLQTQRANPISLLYESVQKDQGLKEPKFTIAPDDGWRCDCVVVYQKDSRTTKFYSSAVEKKKKDAKREAFHDVLAQYFDYKIKREPMIMSRQPQMHYPPAQYQHPLRDVACEPRHTSKPTPKPKHKSKVKKSPKTPSRVESVKIPGQNSNSHCSTRPPVTVIRSPLKALGPAGTPNSSSSSSSSSRRPRRSKNDGEDSAPHNKRLKKMSKKHKGLKGSHLERALRKVTKNCSSDPNVPVPILIPCFDDDGDGEHGDEDNTVGLHTVLSPVFSPTMAALLVEVSPENAPKPEPPTVHQAPMTPQNIFLPTSPTTVREIGHSPVLSPQSRRFRIPKRKVEESDDEHHDKQTREKKIQTNHYRDNQYSNHHSKKSKHRHNANNDFHSPRAYKKESRHDNGVSPDGNNPKQHDTPEMQKLRQRIARLEDMKAKLHKALNFILRDTKKSTKRDTRAQTVQNDIWKRGIELNNLRHKLTSITSALHSPRNTSPPRMSPPKHNSFAKHSTRTTSRPRARLQHHKHQQDAQQNLWEQNYQQVHQQPEHRRSASTVGPNGIFEISA